MSWVNTVISWCFTIGLCMETVLFSKDVSSAVLGPIISTKAGSFQGTKVIPLGQEHAVNAFLGIPYAEPPTGPQRFNKPKPFHFFPDVFKATDKPPSCFQVDFYIHLPWGDKNSSMSEDCLFLNLWAPERRTADKKTLKPVMVWIHGGGYVVGSSAMDLYDGQVMSALGDVVVVTMNYRLSAFGFLNTFTDDAPGNQALYDQLLALQWVKTNVEYFGGDPERVTIFGESAGAFSAGFLALSPLSRGLFQRVILQSGSSYVPSSQNPSFGVETGNLLAGLVGCANDSFTLSSCPKEVVNCLRSVPACELTKTYYEERDSRKTKINLSFEPQFWDELLPQHPNDIFLSKNFTVYDMFVGVNHVEGASVFAHIFADVYQLYVQGKLIMNKDLAIQLLNGLLKELHFAHPEKVTDFYLKDISNDDQQRIVRAIYEVIGDFMIVCPEVYLAEKYSERGAQVNFYRFDHRPSTSPWPEWMGATHFDELEFVFGLPFRYPQKYEDQEKRLSEYMIRTWTNFAKSEALTLKNGSTWPDYSRSNPVYATFQTDQQITGSGERKTQCEFWRPYFGVE